MTAIDDLTDKSSRFLDVCRSFNGGTIGRDELIDRAVKMGFENVLDAFHNLPSGESILFFDRSGWRSSKKITLTDELLGLNEGERLTNLLQETESRWRLVETAWLLNLSRNLCTLDYDADDGLLFTRSNRRIDITSCRDALEGYQKGSCFYQPVKFGVEVEIERVG